jgi:hypothetical protein
MIENAQVQRNKSNLIMTQVAVHQVEFSPVIQMIIVRFNSSQVDRVKRWTVQLTSLVEE